jgi:hypothetical protein
MLLTPSIVGIGVAENLEPAFIVVAVPSSGTSPGDIDDELNPAQTTSFPIALAWESAKVVPAW